MSSIVDVPHVASTVLVKQSLLFASLPEALIQEIAPYFHLIKWEKGDYIHPENLMTQFYFLQVGQLEMKRNNPDTGREVTLDMLYPGIVLILQRYLIANRMMLFLNPLRLQYSLFQYPLR